MPQLYWKPFLVSNTSTLCIHLPDVSDNSIDRIRQQVEERQLANYCQMRDIERIRRPISASFEEPCVKRQLSPPSTLSVSVSPSPRVPSSATTSDLALSTPEDSDNAMEVTSDASSPTSVASYNAWPPRRTCTMVLLLHTMLISEESLHDSPPKSS